MSGPVTVTYTDREDLLDHIEMAAARVETARVALAEKLERRDALIRIARSRGISLREIGEAANLHHTAVRKAAGETKEDPR